MFSLASLLAPAPVCVPLPLDDDALSCDLARIMQGLPEPDDEPVSAAVPAFAAVPVSVPVAVPVSKPTALGQFKQDMIVLTSRLNINDDAMRAHMDRVVRGLEEYCKMEGVKGADADDLEAELLEGTGGKAPRKRRVTKKSTQSNNVDLKHEWNGVPTTMVVRFQDYTTAANIRRSNFRNQITLRHGTTSGPTLKLFRNGTLQGAGWKTVAQFTDYVNSIAAELDLPGVDTVASKLSLVNGSARIRCVPGGGILMDGFRDSIVAAGHTIKWDPSTGNNGANVKVPVGDDTRSAMVFSNGFVKMFAKSEEQLVRVYEKLDVMLGAVL